MYDPPYSVRTQIGIFNGKEKAHDWPKLLCYLIVIRALTPVTNRAP